METYNKGEISRISESIFHYIMGYEYFCIGDLNNFQEEMRKAYIVSQEIGVDTELVEIATTRVKENMIIYYNKYYEGDKTSGFDAWFEEFISQ